LFDWHHNRNCGSVTGVNRHGGPRDHQSRPTGSDLKKS